MYVCVVCARRLDHWTRLRMHSPISAYSLKLKLMECSDMLFDISAYALFVHKINFKMLNKLKYFLYVYLHILCTHLKFCEKVAIFHGM
jgi:hypothetical protein